MDQIKKLISQGFQCRVTWNGCTLAVKYKSSHLIGGQGWEFNVRYFYIISEVYRSCNRRSSDPSQIFLPVLFLGSAPDYFINALNNGLNLSFTVPHLTLIFASLWDTKAFVALSCWKKIKKHEMNKNVVLCGIFPGVTVCVFFILLHVLYRLYTYESQVRADVYAVGPVKTMKLCMKDREQIRTKHIRCLHCYCCL